MSARRLLVVASDHVGSSMAGPGIRYLWFARELASRIGHRVLPPGPPPRESARPPGWMPGSFDGG